MTITSETIFVGEILVTDTIVYEIIARTTKTITVRRTKDGASKPERDLRVDGGTDPQCPPVMWTEQVPDENGNVSVLRLRKDGTYRMGRSSNPLFAIEGTPKRRTDYRF